MQEQRPKKKLLTIVGPTASGKTKLAVELAKAFDGEVVSADSMQIYQKMSIATAKPTKEEMEGVPHHLIDFLPMDKAFSVSDYVTLAREKIEEIHRRGKLPILAGGTGLYIQAVTEHLSFSEEKQDTALRERLYEEAKTDGGKALYERLRQIDPEAAEWIHPNNIVRVVRAVEIYETTGLTMTEQKKKSRQGECPYDVFLLGINFKDRQKLYDRINLRVDLMVKQGLLEEAREILSCNNLKTAYNAIGYKELVPYFRGESSLEECLQKMKQESRRYAKRQLTWFRRDQQVHWLYPDELGDFQSVFKEAKLQTEVFLSAGTESANQ